jgi:hypothetical protein
MISIDQYYQSVNRVHHFKNYSFYKPGKARVVEEIRVTKDVEEREREREETVRETLRETKVDIENDTKRSGRRDLTGTDTGYDLPPF